MQLEPVWLLFFFIMYYFFTISYNFRYLSDKFFIFSKPVINVIKEKKVRRSDLKFHASEYLIINTVNLRYLIFLVILYFICFNYIFSIKYVRLYQSFHCYNFCWIYGNFIIGFFFLYLIILYCSYYVNYLKGIEHLFAVSFLFLNMHYFIFLNNLIVLVFLFELQSIIFMYYIALLHFNYLNHNYYINKQNPQFKSFNFQWYINSLFFQFWVSFVGVIFFVYGVFYIYRFAGFFDWSHLNLFFFFYKYSWSMLSHMECLFAWLIFFIGLLLKIGFFPFFLWKPEIYKNFNIFVLFFYMFIYLFFVLFFLFFFFNNFLLLTKGIWYIYIYYVYTIASISLLFYMYSIYDIRSFLAYSSALNLCYLLIILTINSFAGFAAFLFYLFVYSFYIFNFFAFIFLISNNFLWFFTDLQYLGNFIFLICFFFSFFFGLAGIPPFLGFFAKICIVSTLLYEEQYFFFFLFLFVGLFASYFYLQTYRFSGFSVKSIYYINRVVSFKFTGFFLYLNYFLLMVNFLSIFFLPDIYLFATWIALNA